MVKVGGFREQSDRRSETRQDGALRVVEGVELLVDVMMCQERGRAVNKRK